MFRDHNLRLLRYLIVMVMMMILLDITTTANAHLVYHSISMDRLLHELGVEVGRRMVHLLLLLLLLW